METQALRILPFFWNEEKEIEVSEDPKHLFELDHLEEVEHIKMAGMRVQITYDKVLGRFSLTARTTDGLTRPLLWRAYPEG